MVQSDDQKVFDPVLPEWSKHRTVGRCHYVNWSQYQLHTRFLKYANHSSSSRRGVVSIIMKLNASISFPTPKTSQLQSPTPRSHQFLRDWRRPRKNPAWPYGSSHRKQPAPERKVNSGGSFTNLTLDMGRGHVLTMNFSIRNETKIKPSVELLSTVCSIAHDMHIESWIRRQHDTIMFFLLASNGLTMPLWLHDVNKKGPQHIGRNSDQHFTAPFFPLSMQVLSGPWERGRWQDRRSRQSPCDILGASEKELGEIPHLE